MQVCYCFKSYKHAIKRRNLGQNKWAFQYLVSCPCQCKDPLSPILPVYIKLIFLYITLLIPKNFVECFWSQRIWKHQISETTSEVECRSFLTQRGINYPSACRQKSGAGSLSAELNVPSQIYGFFKIRVEALAKPRPKHLTRRTLPWAQPLPGLCKWMKSQLQVTKPSMRHGMCMLKILSCISAVSPQLEVMDSRAFPSQECPTAASSWLSLLSSLHQIAGCPQGSVGAWKGCLRKPMNQECWMDFNDLRDN